MTVMADVFKFAFFIEAGKNPALKEKVKDIPGLALQASFMPSSLRAELGL